MLRKVCIKNEYDSILHNHSQSESHSNTSTLTLTNAVTHSMLFVGLTCFCFVSELERSVIASAGAALDADAQQEEVDESVVEFLSLADVKGNVPN